MNLSYLFNVLYKKSWIIILCTIIAIGGAIYFTKGLKKSYKSTAEIATGFTMNDQVRIDDKGFDVYSIDLKFNNVIQTITSAQVMNLLSYNLILHDINNPNVAFRKLDNSITSSDLYKSVNFDEAKEIYASKIRNMQMLSSYNPEERKLIQLLELYEYGRESLQKSILVYRVERTDYINIDCFSENPLLSAFIANDLVKEFNRFYNAYLSQRSAANVQLLDTLIARKRDILNQKQAMLNQVMRGGDIDIMTANLDLIKQYQSQLTDEQSQLTSARVSLEEVDRQLKLLQSNRDHTFNNNSDILQLNREINDLYSQYINGGSRDEALMNRIETLRKELQEKYSNSSSLSDLPSKGDLLQKKSDLNVKVQAANQNISYLKSMINNLNGDVRSSASKDITVNALKKEVELASDELASAQGKYNDALNNIAQGNQFKQILLGQPAVNPEPSKRMIVILLAGAAAFCICITVILFLEYIDFSIKAPSFFQRQTGLKILGVINRVDLRKYGLISLLSEGSSNGHLKRKNTFREHIRKLRHEIEGSGCETILFTSTIAGQGKTTLTQALAYSFNLSKKKVLIIDTNFCNNDLTVQLKAKPRLEEFSMEVKNVSKRDIMDFVSSSDVAGTDIIGCIGGDYTPNEILPKKGNLLQYLTDLKKYYDYILLEAAPMNKYADTKELLGYVDAIVLVFSSQAVVKEVDKEAIGFLKSLNGKFLGAILNKVELQNIEI